MNLYRISMTRKSTGQTFTFESRAENPQQAIDKIFEFFPMHNPDDMQIIKTVDCGETFNV